MLKPLKFVGSSRKGLSAFPDEVRQEIGHALFVAQQGGRAPNVKTLQGFGGGGVVELVEEFDGDAYRCVYTTKVKDVIVVLHAFQKKSKRGSETSKHDIELVQSRLREALTTNWN
jgi:phage-related protein